MEYEFAQKRIDGFMDDFYNDDNYELCMKKAKEFYRIVEKMDNNKHSDYYKWASTLMIARCYNKLNNHNKSLKYILLNLRYTQTNIDKINSYSTLARCYAELKEFDKSVLYFDKVIDYYLNKNDCKNLAKMLNMKAWYTNDEKTSLRSIEILENIELTEEVINEIVESYDTLLNIYSTTNQYDKVVNTYKGFDRKSDELKIKLQRKLSNYLVSFNIK